MGKQGILAGACQRQPLCFLHSVFLGKGQAKLFQNPLSPTATEHEGATALRVHFKCLTTPETAVEP